VNVTLPADTDLGDGESLNSLSVTVEDFEAALDVETTTIAANTPIRPSTPTRRCGMDTGGDYARTAWRFTQS
jgi:hypothetical protein